MHFNYLFTLLIVIIITTVHLHPASSQSTHNITLGATLTTSSTPSSWLSSSRDFAFGFLPLSTEPAKFLLAIWFNKTPNRTAIWTANNGNPVPTNSTIQLTPNGQLSLKSPNNQELWNANVSGASYAAMLNSGNFVIMSSSGVTKWQSFDYPTDTILGGQVLRQGGHLFARILENDYTPGRFEMILQDDGNLVMYPLGYPTNYPYDPYWSSGTNGSGLDTLVYNESGSIYLSFKNGSSVSVISGAILADNYYQRATLDPDGVFRQYVFPKNQPTTGSWQVKGSLPLDICSSVFVHFGSGACGFNSYCFMQNGMPECQCPPHYTFVDPTRKYQGCKPDFISQSCDPNDKNNPSFNLTEIDNVDWPLSDAEHYYPVDEDQCIDLCLKDCFCPVAIYNNQSCWKKKFPLSNGKKANDVNRQAFIKYSTVTNSSEPFPTVFWRTDKKDWKTWVLVGSLLIAGSVALNLFSVCFICQRKRKSLSPRSSNVTGPALCSFTYKELVEATDGFKEELGRGAFGVVYKGVLESEPKLLVAVKRLESLQDDAEKDFDNEVKTIGQTHHKNLVRLFGFCKEGDHRLLVYEFMSNGSLYKLLFGSQVCPDWSQRVQIVLGIAGGLAYLHEECTTQVIHCDIKPQNILLDDKMEAKISDFGLAKLLRLDQTRTSTGIRGTIGYFAPEWFKNVPINAKVDVYSFGVMLLEIVCCKKNFDWRPASGEVSTVVEYAKECYRNGTLELLVEGDEEAKKDGMMLERFVMVGISCIQEEPWLRPSMKKVAQMLEGFIPVPIPPNMYSIN